MSEKKVQIVDCTLAFWLLDCWTALLSFMITCITFTIREIRNSKAASVAMAIIEYCENTSLRMLTGIYHFNSIIKTFRELTTSY